ncbi:MAG: hypothetical protein MJZ15_06960, partial [Bacteroidales bacterium]|nr:hypothetical protein [Bacteroidales bacterium]
NNTLTFNAGTSDQQAIYAYDDTTVVGKLDVQAYSYKDVKVHLVRVNNTKTLGLGKIEKEVNDIWQQAVVKYTFDELEPITIDYANKEHFVHGGKGTFQNYNADQKTAIKALPETADDNDYYLFFVDCYDRLDTAGMKSNEPVSGYMPVGRHYGFIYNEFNNTRTISHELGHGVNVLHHTFSDDSESFHATAKTDNLMDYNGGTALNHKQWQWSHEKHRNVLGFLDDEGESEERKVDDSITEIVRTFCANHNYIDGSEKVFDDDLIDKYLSIDGNRYIYRKYIQNLKSNLGILSEKHVVFTDNESSSVINGVIRIGANSKFTRNDVCISLFHEYLHSINELIGIYKYKLNEDRTIFSIQNNVYIEDTINVNSVEELNRILETDKNMYQDLQDSYIDFVLSTTGHLLDNINLSDFENYILSHTDGIKIQTSKIEVVYMPTNYVRDELSVYHWCVEYQKYFGEFSKNKLDIYNKWIETYKNNLLKYSKYEKDHNMGVDGSGL